MWTERTITVTWTNWTFGAWAGDIGTERAWGVDLGPLEITWKRHHLPPQKQLHPRVRAERKLVSHPDRG